MVFASQVPNKGFGWLLLFKCRGEAVASQKLCWLVVDSLVPGLIGCCFPYAETWLLVPGSFPNAEPWLWLIVASL